MTFAILGTTELFIVFIIILLVFGAKNIPRIARSLGSATKEFKTAREDFERELHSASEKEKVTELNTPEEAISRDVEVELKDDNKS